MMLATENRFRVAWLENIFSGKTLNTDALKKYRFLSKIKLRPPIEIEQSLNFRALMPIR